ncbi:toxin-antitoxin system YwqK family antitoxin [Mucilaginibacter terrae]|uniref:Antitoxin component YwqK of YwqJK toxin-antitoxin module n=1 Tax=Mucilaginibacter terrae TaxID=1955052 RepID=A0ABU3GVR0_9SPHI|nr:hypothetical protein [Mucilaginibacter terrae]MDT3403750.1 antitoxin component YwqK of YwqJK toxin-antitoxin module [Mucilaginibacter terrae]
MKRLLILLLWIPFVATAQKQMDYDPDKIRITEPDKTIIAHTTTDKADANYRDRLYYWYGSNTIHQTQGSFSGKLLNGQYQEFYPNKNLHEQGKFKKGLKHGVWQSWNEQGGLKEHTTWKEGQKAGYFELFNNNGQLLKSGTYKNNVLNGKISNYKGTDSVQTVKYKAGKLVIADTSKTSLWQRVKHFRFKKKKNVQATR